MSTTQCEVCKVYSSEDIEHSNISYLFPITIALKLSSGKKAIQLSAQ